MLKPRSYIIITANDKDKIFYHLIDKLPNICLVGAKDNDLFFAIPDNGCGFSLKQLKQSVAEVAPAEINIADIYDDGDVIFYDDLCV